MHAVEWDLNKTRWKQKLSRENHCYQMAELSGQMTNQALKKYPLAENNFVRKITKFR
jgi:hypothetical protein